MEVGVYPKQNAESAEELNKKLAKIINELNETKEANCWICNEVVKNWGVVVPGSGPDGLGIGAGSKDKEGNPATRIAFFPFCPHHNLDDEKNIRNVQMKLSTLKNELSN